MEQINTDFVRLGKCQTGVVTNQARVERALFLPTFVRMNEDIFEGIPYLAWYIIIYTLLLSAGTFFICVKDFFFGGGRRRVARFRMSKGSGRRAASRLFNL